jgi:hypothetical protein
VFSQIVLPQGVVVQTRISGQPEPLTALQRDQGWQAEGLNDVDGGRPEQSRRITVFAASTEVNTR